MPIRPNVVAILRKQFKEAKASVSRLDEAIRALERLGGKGPGRRRGHRMSAAGRKRIAAAQRKRWAKLRLVKH
jgi:hypothetical protein